MNSESILKGIHALGGTGAHDRHKEPSDSPRKPRASSPCPPDEVTAHAAQTTAGQPGSPPVPRPVLAWQGQASSPWGKCMLPTPKQTLTSRGPGSPLVLRVGAQYYLEGSTGGTADALQEHTRIVLTSRSSYLHPSCSWDDRHVPPAWLSLLRWSLALFLP
jgi:hypothetical protein